MVAEENGREKMEVVTMQKSILMSNTTRSVAGATAVGGGGVLAALAWFRSMGALPWSEDQDAVMAIFVTTFLVPVLSRWIKRAIDAVKGNSGYTALVMLVCASLLVGGGCITTTAPDGTITRQADLAATIAITEQTLHLVEVGYAMYLELPERGAMIEAARSRARASESAERMAVLRDLLTTLYVQQQQAEATD